MIDFVSASSVASSTNGNSAVSETPLFLTETTKLTGAGGEFEGAFSIPQMAPLPQGRLAVLVKTAVDGFTLYVKSKQGVTTSSHTLVNPGSLDPSARPALFHAGGGRLFVRAWDALSQVIDVDDGFAVSSLSFTWPDSKDAVAGLALSDGNFAIVADNTAPLDNNISRLSIINLDADIVAASDTFSTRADSSGSAVLTETSGGTIYVWTIASGQIDSTSFVYDGVSVAEGAEGNLDFPAVQSTIDGFTVRQWPGKIGFAYTSHESGGVVSDDMGSTTVGAGDWSDSQQTVVGDDVFTTTPTTYYHGKLTKFAGSKVALEGVTIDSITGVGSNASGSTVEVTLTAVEDCALAGFVASNDVTAEVVTITLTGVGTQLRAGVPTTVSATITRTAVVEALDEHTWSLDVDASTQVTVNGVSFGPNVADIDPSKLKALPFGKALGVVDNLTTGQTGVTVTAASFASLTIEGAISEDDVLGFTEWAWFATVEVGSDSDRSRGLPVGFSSNITGYGTAKDVGDVLHKRQGNDDLVSILLSDTYLDTLRL